MFKALFSDIDGTILNSKHQMTPATRNILQDAQEYMHMALVSARSPSGIYPILEKNQLSMAVISYNGAWIQDEKRNMLYEHGMPSDQAAEIIHFLEQQIPTAAWCLYSEDTWIVKNRCDHRIQREEKIVEAVAIEGSLHTILSFKNVHKILCICPEHQAPVVTEILSSRFPQLTIVPSSEILVEIMAGGTNKANAVRFLCNHWSVPLEATVAFGDNYNDLDMLKTVGCGVLMGNAPEKLKQQGLFVTSDYDHDGIERFLRKNMISNQSNKSGTNLRI